MNRIEFVIFDLDGTLVDSESLCNQAYIDLLPELSERSSTEALIEMNRGRKLAEILTGLQEAFGLELDATFEPRYRKRVEELFTSHLQPIQGVPEMLAALDLPKCIASSSPLAKIRHALKTCGLLQHFQGHIYSSYEVQSWKPDPGLHQHAMAAAGFLPHQCAVVEDSEPGIQAAKAAGAQAFWYAPEQSFSNEQDCVVFQSMADLPALIFRENDAARPSADIPTAAKHE